MKKRGLQHLLFWILFLLLNVGLRLAFAGPTDMKFPFGLRFLRFVLYEAAFLIWKVIPFYIIFYLLVPRYFTRGKYIQFAGLVLLSLLVAIYGSRSLIAPMSNYLYGEVPDFRIFTPSRIFFTLMDIVPIIGFAAAIKLLKGKINIQRRVSALQMEKRTAELNFLKAQSNPHFLFNTLNNIYGLARKSDKRTAESILKLSNILRFIVKEGSSDSIPLKWEVEVIENYIDLESMRYDESLSTRFIKEIDDEMTAIAPLILLPFVENAFKHGVSESRFRSIVEIYLKLNAGDLVFRVANTFTKEEGAITMGVGLKNVKRQLELIYGDGAKLEISAEKEMFEVFLKVKTGMQPGTQI